MKYLFLFITIIFSASLSGQYNITGSIFSSDNEALIGATVLLLEKSDSTMLEFCLTNDKGYFEIRGIEDGEYIIQSSYVGFTDLLMEVVSDWNEKEIDLGILNMENSKTVLTEVEVKAERIPMGIYGDTISYNADAFKTRPNATVEDLLKKLPGIEVDRDGSIKAQGEDVNKVLVDGKEFFGDDPKMATKNLQAEAVDKVQVFDKKSEVAEFTGVDDGEEEKAINLKLKEEYKNGGFGEVDVAKGNEDTYEGKLNYFRFSPTMQAAFIAARNNVNNETFSMNDRIAFLGGIGNFINAGGLSNAGLQGVQDGLNTSTSLGTNLNIDISPKLEFNAHYVFNELQNDLTSQTLGQHLADNFNYNSVSDAMSERMNRSHQVNSKLIYKYNPLTELILRNNLSWSKMNNSDKNFSDYSREGIALGMTQQLNEIESNDFGYDLGCLLKRRFKKKGRSFIGNVLLKRTNSNSDDQISNINALRDPFNNLNQFQVYENALDQNKFNFKYTEPIAKKVFLIAEFAFDKTKEKPRREFFDIDGNVRNLNLDLTSDFTKLYEYNLAGVSIRRNAKRLKMVVGLKSQFTTLIGELNASERIETNYVNFLPSFNLDYKLKGGKKVSLDYRTNITAPRLDELMPIPDNRNPNFIFLGNPDLNPSYTHEMGLNFHLFDNFSLTSLFFSAYTNISKNRIVSKTEIDENLFSTVTPINSDKFNAYGLNGSFSRPFRPLKIKYGIRADIRLSQFDSFLNSRESQVTDNTYNIKASVSNRNTDHVFIEAGLKLEQGVRKYSIDPTFNQNYSSFDYYIDSDFYLPYNFTFSNELSFMKYSNEGFENSPDFTFWHLSLSKLFFKEKLELSFSIYDVLNQNIGYERFGTPTAIMEKSFNNLGRYFMLGVKYKIGKSKSNDGIQIDFEG